MNREKKLAKTRSADMPSAINALTDDELVAASGGSRLEAVGSGVKAAGKALWNLVEVMGSSANPLLSELYK